MMSQRTMALLGIGALALVLISRQPQARGRRGRGHTPQWAVGRVKAYIARRKGAIAPGTTFAASLSGGTWTVNATWSNQPVATATVDDRTGAVSLTITQDFGVMGTSSGIVTGADAAPTSAKAAAPAPMTRATQTAATGYQQPTRLPTTTTTTRPAMPPRYR